MPKTIVNAIKQIQSEYTGGSSYISASGITKSPRIFHLEKRHGSKVDQDASEFIWSLIGTLIHGILEKAADYTEEARAEERLYKEVLGEVFSGQYDLIEGNTLYDYKVTSVWSVLKDHKFEWEAQANLNRLLLHEHGTEIDNLEIVCILRDWQKTKAKIDKAYPQTQIKRVKLPVWSLERADNYLIDKITELQSHENTPDNELPTCTQAEMWQDDTTYAVMKKGAKRASKLFQMPLEATIYAKQIGGYVEERESIPKRCLDYCSVNKFCNQFLESKYAKED